MTAGSRKWISVRLFAVVLCGGLLAWVFRLSAQDHKRLTLYSPHGTTFVTVADHDGKEFVSLDEILLPLGGSVSVADKQVRMHVGKAEGECTAGASNCKLRGNQMELGANLWLEGQAPMVPLHVLPQMLSLLLDSRFDYHANSRRLFLPGSGVRFTAETKKGEADSVVFTFGAAVNPSISTEPGRLHMTFTRDAVSSGAEQIKFDTPHVAAATYSESNGAAEIVVHGSAPLMAVFGDGGRTITVSAIPASASAATPPAQAAAQAPSPPETSASQAPPAGPQSSANTTSVLPTIPVLPRGGRFVVVIDASHGGDDRGAQLTEKLAEKDITLALGRRLRGELQNRGVTSFLLRDGDNALALEDRASAANAAHATLYIAVHAGTNGRGVRVYSSILREKSGDEPAPGGFIPWERAQAASAANSRAFAVAMIEDLADRKVPAQWSPAPVRPLNNVLGMAIAVEVAPPPEKDAAALANGNYQQGVAVNLANSILAARTRLEAK